MVVLYIERQLFPCLNNRTQISPARVVKVPPVPSGTRLLVLQSRPLRGMKAQLTQ